MPAEPTTGPISVEEYLGRVLARIRPMDPFEHSLLDALGLPVAQDIHAEVPLPMFDNSAMDGYAVAFRDVADAGPERPVHLPVVGEIAAGDASNVELTPGTALRIMTGAPIPRGCQRRRARSSGPRRRGARSSCARPPRRASTSGARGRRSRRATC